MSRVSCSSLTVWRVAGGWRYLPARGRERRRQRERLQLGAHSLDQQWSKIIRSPLFCFESSCASRSNRQKMACETRVLWKAFLKNSLRSLQEFEDLDEITARYIQPMASFARDLLGHKYFQECHGGSKEVHRIHSPVCFAISLILSVFARSCASHISVCLVFSPTENGGVIGEDEEGEAHFYSLFYFSL